MCLKFLFQFGDVFFRVFSALLDAVPERPFSDKFESFKVKQFSGVSRGVNNMDSGDNMVFITDESGLTESLQDTTTDLSMTDCSNMILDVEMADTQVTDPIYMAVI